MSTTALRLDAPDVDRFVADLVAAMTFAEAQAAYPDARAEHEARAAAVLARPTQSLYNRATAFGPLAPADRDALRACGWPAHGEYAKALLAIRAGRYDDALRAGRAPYSTTNALRAAGAARVAALRAAELAA